MSTAVNVLTFYGDDGEGLLVRVEDQVIGTVYTSYDCPEDNFIGRLGVNSLVIDLVETLGFPVYVNSTNSESEWDEAVNSN